MTRAVVFDVDGVLVHGYHSKSDEREAWDAALAEHGINADRFQREFVFDIFLKRVLIGEVPMVEALDRRLKAFGYKGSTMTILDLWLSFDCNPNTALLETIGKLRERDGVALYIATNQDHSRAQFLWQTIGLRDYFADMFYSARFGRTKYQQKFFEMAEDRMIQSDLPPLFFDDTQKVLDVAAKAGWETVLFTDNHVVSEHPWLGERLR